LFEVIFWKENFPSISYFFKSLEIVIIVVESTSIRFIVVGILSIVLIDGREIELLVSDAKGIRSPSNYNPSMQTNTS